MIADPVFPVFRAPDQVARALRADAARADLTVP
jgi:hypothetical protein